MANLIQAYYFIGTMSGTYTKVYDGKKMQADVLTYDGYLNTDSFQPQITKGNLTHVNQYGTMVYDETLGKNVGTLDLLYDDGYPKVYRNGVDVTSEYNQTQIKDYTFENKDPGNMTFTIISRDITLESSTITKEYDGTALVGGGSVTDLTAGQTDKGYVSGEEFAYTFTGSQLLVGESDNSFDVGDSATALTADYNVTKQYGKLIVTGRTSPLTITVADQEKTYDGTAAFDTTAYTVSGDLAYNDTITVTLSNSKVDAGDYTDAITASYKIVHDNGDGTTTDVTSMYLNVTVDAGDFTINKRNVTITSATDSKVYDGTPLTNDNTAITSGSFVSGEGYVANVTGSQTEIGSSPNYFTVEAAAGTNLNNYNITKVEGTLIVIGWDQLVTITADSNEQMYNGTKLTDSGYTVTGLAAGHTATVTVSGEITHYGTADNVVSSYTIYDENGQDVTTAYTNVQTEKGTLSITKRDVTLTSASVTKPYDGTPLTNDTVTVSGDGFFGTEGASYSVTGSQTAVGTSKNTFSYVLNSNTSADDYAIHAVEGDLTVTPAEFIITIDTEIGSGLEFLYDNTSTKVLTADQYQIEGLIDTDEVVNVTITTNSSNAGTYDEDMYTLTYDIVDKVTGESTKSNYVITEYKHDVDITKRTITLEADTTSKVYDGTALTCYTYTVAEGETEEYLLLDGEKVVGVGFTADSTITHAGSTANKIDATNVTIDKADGSDSSMNYNILTEDGTLTVDQRGVLLQSTSADKFYDGTALQNRQVVITGVCLDDNGNVLLDEDGDIVYDLDGGFLAGDGCTYDFVNDNVVIDSNGNVIAWVAREQSDTAYGQTEVGTSKNEFNYNNFTSVYADSLESDYVIVYGFNQEELGLSTDILDLFGDLTVWGGPVEIYMTDYSWTYDYQAKTNGYFDDGYTVVVTTNEEGTEKAITEIAHNSEGYEIALLGNDTIKVNVTGEDGAGTKVQHVGTNKQNEASYTIYRDGVDVTSEVEEYYQISIDGGKLSITPRTVVLTSGSESKVYDGTALTNNTVIEGGEGRDTGFIFGEGAAYEVTGSQTEVGASANTFAISELLTDTKATDYNFVLNEGTLTVTPVTTDCKKGDLDGNGIADIIMTIDAAYHPHNGATGAWLVQIDQSLAWDPLSTRNNGCSIIGTGFSSNNKTTADVYVKTAENVLGAWVTDASGAVTGWETVRSYDAVTEIVGLGDFNGDGQTDVLLRNVNGAVGVDFTSGTQTGWDYLVSLGEEWTLAGIGDLNNDGLDDIVVQHDVGYTGAYLMQTDGTAVWSDLSTLGEGYGIVGCGDFNGDGTDDVLLRNGDTYGAWIATDGSVDRWMGLGSFAGTVEDIADFNGDGVDDLRLRTDAGDIGAQLVAGEDSLQWQYYGSVGSEWKTSLASV